MEDLSGKKDKFNKLANQLKTGDRQAGEEIFNHFSPLIYRFFMARILNQRAAEDLTQDVFLKIVSKIDTFNDKAGNFSGWIWQVARNSLIDYFRAKKEVVFSDAPEGIENMYRVDDAVDRRINAKEIIEIVNNFEDDEQEVFALYYLSDLAYKEMSKITGRSEGSLRVAIHRMNKKIRKIVNGQKD